MNQILFLMAVRNRQERAVASIKSVVDSGLGKYFDFLIVQDVDQKNVSLMHFDLSVFNKDTIGKIEIIDVKIGGMFNKTLLLNHGIRMSKNPFIIQQDADILFGRPFLLSVLKICSNPSLLNKFLFLCPYVESEDMKESVEHIGWPPRKKGDEAGKSFLLYRPQIEAIHGYDERMKIWNEEYDLINRLEAKFGIKRFSLEKNGIKNIHVTHSNDERSNCTGEINNRNLRICMENLNNNNLMVNPNGWGEITRQYETNF